MARSSSDAAAGTGDPGRKWLILSVTVAVAFMAQMDLFAANFSLPSIGRSLGGPPLSDLSWVLNANAIVFAALLVPAGRLADQWGRRRFLVMGVGLFTLATALAAAAPDLAVLVLGRALEGAGAAMMVPTSLGLLLPAFPSQQHTMVAGIWAGVAGLGAACAGPVSGLLLGVDWRLVFLVNVPIGLATVVAGWKYLPEIRARRDASRPDPLSVGTLLGAVTLLVLATVEGSSWGWGSAEILVLYAGAAVLAAATARRSVRHAGAVIEGGLFRVRQFATGTVALLLYYVAFSAWLLTAVLFLQDAWHLGLLRSGLALAPAPLTAAVFGAASGRIGRLLGNRTLAIVGPLSMALSAALWLLGASMRPAYTTVLLPGLILGGVSSGLTQAALYATAGALPGDRQATGSAVLNTARQIGSAVGVALAVVLLAAAHPHDLLAFHRAWVLIAAAAFLAAAVVALDTARSGARPLAPAASPAPVAALVPAPAAAAAAAGEAPPTCSSTSTSPLPTSVSVIGVIGTEPRLKGAERRRRFRSASPSTARLHRPVSGQPASGRRRSYSGVRSGRCGVAVDVEQGSRRRRALTLAPAIGSEGADTGTAVRRHERGGHERGGHERGGLERGGLDRCGQERCCHELVGRP